MLNIMQEMQSTESRLKDRKSLQEKPSLSLANILQQKKKGKKGTYRLKKKIERHVNKGKYDFTEAKYGPGLDKQSKKIRQVENLNTEDIS